MAETKSEVSEQDKFAASLLNNIAVVASSESTDGLHAGIAMVRRAMAINPLDFGQSLNLANFLMTLGEDDEAEQIARDVLKREERAAIAWQILGTINTNRGHLQEAIASFKRAHEADPFNGQYKFDLAAAYLRAGDFAKGLPLYEFRNEILPKTGPTPDAPVWKGEKTGHLIVWPDQGHGDHIMFARFIPWAKERAEKVTFVVTPLLLQLLYGYSSIPGVEVTHVWSSDTKFDHQIRLSSLPLIYGLTPNNIPPDPGLIHFAQTAGSLGSDGLKIGIAWQGNPQFPSDRMRSIPFREFLPLAADPRNTVFSLQVGPASADIAKAHAQRLVCDMSRQIDGAWSHTAALIKSLDLVVTSCTAIAHLAGALGVPTFVVIGKFAYWVWMHGREDTPWYPNTRLFRQTKVGDWASPMKQVCAAVNDLHDRRAFAAMLGKLHAEQHYEPEVQFLMRKALRPGDRFVDIGANKGIHTKLAAELVGPEGLVIAFEPGENVLPELRKNVAGMDNVFINETVVGNFAGEVTTFYLNSDDSGGNALWDPAKWPYAQDNPKSRERQEPRALPTVTLDSFFLPSPPVRLIKIDTEGAEQLILEGGKELLESDKRPPFIVAEWHEFGLKQFGHDQQSLRELMHGYDYDTFVLSADGSKPQRVNPEDRIKSPVILNLLFSTQEAVDEVWATDSVQEWLAA